MAEFFGGGYLRFVDGEWRNDYGDVVDVTEIRHGEWIHTDYAISWIAKDECSECHYHTVDRIDLSYFNYCPNCGAKMNRERR